VYNTNERENGRLLAIIFPHDAEHARSDGNAKPGTGSNVAL